MKLIFALLVGLIFFITAGAQKCEDVRLGTFKIAGDEVNPNESILTRTDKYQFEEVKSKGIKMQFDLKWTSDCSYELSKPRVLKGELPNVSESQVLYVKIIRVTSTDYTAEITSNFADFKLEKKIIIVK